jgi:type I restriction enzyme S subunit
VFYLEEDYWPLNTSLYVIDFKGNDPRFVRFFLRNLLWDYQSDKAAVPGIDRNVLHRLEVRLPEPQTQRRIATSLARYDDLIANNHRRMELLESSAHLLYDEWFVRLQFPGYMSAIYRGEVPEVWEQVPVPRAV